MIQDRRQAAPGGAQLLPQVGDEFLRKFRGEQEDAVRGDGSRPGSLCPTTPASDSVFGHCLLLGLTQRVGRGWGGSYSGDGGNGEGVAIAEPARARFRLRRYTSPNTALSFAEVYSPTPGHCLGQTGGQFVTALRIDQVGAVGRSEIGD